MSRQPHLNRLLAIALVVGLSALACEEGIEISRTDGGGPGDAPVADRGVVDRQPATDVGVGGNLATDGNVGVGGAGIGGNAGAGGAGGSGLGGNGSGGQATGGTVGSTGGSGGGGQAMLTSTMTSVNLGNLEVGVTSPMATWTIKNSGTASTGPLLLNNLDSVEIKIATNCSLPLAAGDSCTITFTFQASATGARNGQLTLTGTSGGSVSLSVTANGMVRLTVVTSGTGTVTSVPAGITCGATCSALFDPGSVSLQARPTNGSGFRFSAWGGAAAAPCPGLSHDCLLTISGATTANATFTQVTNNLVFATQTHYQPNLGGVAAYDAKCNAAATAAGINNGTGNGYIALISSTASLARTRLGSARGWVRMDGKPYADTQTALFTNKQVFNAVLFDETGFVMVMAGRGATDSVMTGTNADGTLATGITCNDWTTTVSTLSAMGGSVSQGPSGYGSVTSGCDFVNGRLMCMGITKTTAVTPIVTAGRKIWTTKGVFMPGPMTPDAACQAEKPTGVTMAAALLAYTNRTGSSVLDPTTSYVRPDGTLVGTGTQIINGTLNAILPSGNWQSADGTYDATNYSCWTGSPDLNTLGTVGSTCNNWTDISTPTATIGSIADTQPGSWGGGPNNFCNNTLHLNCVQISP